MDSKSLKIQLLLFFGAVLCLSAAGGIHESIFNNFLSDTFSLTADGRGFLELPRELPGFLVVLMTGILSTLAVTRIGVIGSFVFAAGMVGLAFFGTQYWSMVIVMIIGSAGMHLLQPIGGTIVMSLSNENNKGIRMAQMGVVRTLGMILGCGLVWISFDKISPQYRLGFLCAAVCCGIGGVVYSFMYIPHLTKPSPRFVIKKKFNLYYILEFLFGARKQIFITFGPWVLIKVYKLPATSIAGLLLIGALIGIGTKLFIGTMIDKFGERIMLIADGIVLALICVGYGYAAIITGSLEKALPLACACYIIDNLLFSIGTARTIYVSRLTESPQELTSTLAMGVSINHIASMTIPIVAGGIWIGFGYEMLFLLAAGLALTISIFSAFIPRKSHT